MTLMRNHVTLLLATARSLLDNSRLDIDATIALLKEMQDDIGDLVQTSVKSALNLARAAKKDRHQEAVARYALARVIVMLEGGERVK